MFVETQRCRDHSAHSSRLRYCCTGREGPTRGRSAAVVHRWKNPCSQSAPSRTRTSRTPSRLGPEEEREGERENSYSLLSLSRRRPLDSFTPSLLDSSTPPLLYSRTYALSLTSPCLSSPSPSPSRPSRPPYPPSRHLPSFDCQDG